jgi:hypothetical protein
MTSAQTTNPQINLAKFAWMSIIVSVIVFGIKMAAWWTTGSVGLLSDALESTVNIVAAVVALFALRTAMKPADAEHHFGRGKAEYFSASIEGFMILLAALIIVFTAIERIMAPRALEQIGWGLTISTVAAVINGGAALILLRAGKLHRSPVLVADGKHLLTDVWTSVGVIVGVGINVSTTKASLPVAHATSIFLVTDLQLDRNELLAKILNNLEKDLLDWQSGKDLTAKYRALSATIGSQVRIALPDGSSVEAVAVDIDETGSLHLDNGQLITVGDVIHLDSKLSQ